MFRVGGSLDRLLSSGRFRRADGEAIELVKADLAKVRRPQVRGRREL